MYVPDEYTNLLSSEFLNKMLEIWINKEGPRYCHQYPDYYFGGDCDDKILNAWENVKSMQENIPEAPANARIIISGNEISFKAKRDLGGYLFKVPCYGGYGLYYFLYKVMGKDDQLLKPLEETLKTVSPPLFKELQGIIKDYEFFLKAKSADKDPMDVISDANANLEKLSIAFDVLSNKTQKLLVERNDLKQRVETLEQELLKRQPLMPAQHEEANVEAKVDEQTLTTHVFCSIAARLMNSKRKKNAAQRREVANVLKEIINVMSLEIPNKLNTAIIEFDDENTTPNVVNYNFASGSQNVQHLEKQEIKK